MTRQGEHLERDDGAEALVTTSGPSDAQLARLAPTAAAAAEYLRGARADSTHRAYAHDWAEFRAWCSSHGLCALPAASATLVLYMTAMAKGGARPATIDRALAAVSAMHADAGIDSPLIDPRIRSVRRGIRRDLGVEQAQKLPVTLTVLRVLLAQCRPTPLGLRDRAVLTVGFFGALRRSEVAAVTVSDLAFVSEGVILHVRRSKTDQEGEGAYVGLPLQSDAEACPVRALRAWLEPGWATDSPAFRYVVRGGRITDKPMSARTVASIVQRLARKAGLAHAGEHLFGAHSLRAGFATSAAMDGRSEGEIMRQGRWKSAAIARKYIRYGSVFVNNAALDLTR